MIGWSNGKLFDQQRGAGKAKKRKVAQLSRPQLERCKVWIPSSSVRVSPLVTRHHTRLSYLWSAFLQRIDTADVGSWLHSIRPAKHCVRRCWDTTSGSYVTCLYSFSLSFTFLHFSSRPFSSLFPLSSFLFSLPSLVASRSWAFADLFRSRHADIIFFDIRCRSRTDLDADRPTYNSLKLLNFLIFFNPKRLVRVAAALASVAFSVWFVAKHFFVRFKLRSGRTGRLLPLVRNSLPNFSRQVEPEHRGPLECNFKLRSARLKQRRKSFSFDFLSTLEFSS